MDLKLAMLSAANSGTSGKSGLLIALFLLIIVTGVAFVLSVGLTLNFLKATKKARHGKVNTSFKILISCSYIVAIAALVLTITCGARYFSNADSNPDPTDDQTVDNTNSGNDKTDSTGENTGNSEPETTDPTEPTYSLGDVHSTSNSNPNTWLTRWEIMADEKTVFDYQRDQSIFFGDPAVNDYSSLPGIITFRGDNYRTGASYGTANIANNTMTTIWTKNISSLAKGTGSGAWTGCGWTGQPLIVEWDKDTIQIMNIYDEKKSKEGLVEVIYATLDGHIYFYDLEDGSYTRDPINIGMAFKGAGALDPRGYPILYVGSGDKTSSGKSPRMYIISLIDGTILHEYGNSDSFALRNWIAFDSSPLVCAETDTLIWPGECGILYTFKLNTAYNKTNGTLSIDPDAPVKVRYSNNTKQTLGVESSAIIVENYLYMGDNGGLFFCIDLNTMEVVWVQDVKDDTNATPVFEWGDDGIGYIYTGSSMEFAEGHVYIYKLNASTGEIVWERKFDDVYYDLSVSGGILASPVLGKKGTELEGMIFYEISKTPGAWSGVLVALDTETGETIWQKSQNLYSWSSPVAVYADDGSAKLIVCDAGGNMFLVDPLTGETLSKISLGSNIEASPAIWYDMLVVGTRGQKVCGIKLS